MRKYGGNLIYRTRDAWGPIEVVEDGRSRSLHFGSEPKQSSMDLHDPVRLELTYTRAMATALLFVQEPASALLLGLGGGSLAKFLLTHTRCRVEAVELREAVVEVARSHFALPQEPRLTICLADAEAWLGDLTAPPRAYDLVFVDAYDHAGMAEAIHRVAFIEAVREVTAEGGVAAFNLWADLDSLLRERLQDLKESFGNLLLLPVEGKANVIALCGRGRALRWQLRKLGDRAKALEAATGLEFTALLKALRKNNALILGNAFF